MESGDVGLDRVRESERAGKKGRAIDVDPAQVEEAVACGLCGEPLIEGATGSMEPRGCYHAGCIRKARQEAFGGVGRETYKYRNQGGRSRRS